MPAQWRGGVVIDSANSGVDEMTVNDGDIAVPEHAIYDTSATIVVSITDDDPDTGKVEAGVFIISTDPDGVLIVSNTSTYDKSDESFDGTCSVNVSEHFSLLADDVVRLLDPLINGSPVTDDNAVGNLAVAWYAPSNIPDGGC